MIENQVFLMGRLARNNELKHFNKQNGDGFVLKNALAVNGKSQNDKTIFIDFTAWNATAKYLCEYCQKGDKIAILGEIVCDEWQDQQTGQNRTKLSVNVKEAKIIVTSKNNQAPQNYNQAPQNYNQAPQNDFINDNEIPF